ncbi:hypothetical protein [Microscilla marina]|uniref:Uncharacterized protein n=1 Tax=Microscilla marina ATCC 23134 TaxID=313606 RepID=A1ZDB0_MICM2|nr:hypothetical protein [Microscilla marina]EAY31649.1 hypothetical protein M23134_05155 [Microscilla marina ATCC 23134]
MITADELLRRCLIHKIYKEWDAKVEELWQEKRWYKIFRNKHPHHLPMSIAKLPNGFFESLAIDINQVIQQKLNVSKQELSLYTISGSSLKRLLGKNKDGTSRNDKKKQGLAIYVGYQNNVFHFEHWDDFYRVYLDYSRFWDYWQKNAFHQQQLGVPLPTEEKNSPTTPPLPVYSPTVQLQLVHEVMQNTNAAQVPWRTSQQKKMLWATAGMLSLVLGLAATWWFWSKKDLASLPQKTTLAQLTPEQIKQRITFSIVKHIKGKNKSTVFVTYDVRQLPIDTISIGSSYHTDITPRLYTSTKKQDTISFIVNKPDGTLYLRHRRTLLKKLRVYQASTHWIGWVHAGKKFIGAYQPTHKLVQDCTLVFPITLVPPQYRSYYFSTLRNTRHYGVDGNYHTFETKIKLINKPSNATCNHLSMTVTGSEKSMQAIAKRLSYELELDGCEYWLNRKKYPVNIASKFTHDIDTYRQWNTFKWVVRGSLIEVYWNNEKILSQTIVKNIGELTNITFSGKGSWAIKWVRLLNKEGKPMYEESFYN